MKRYPDCIRSDGMCGICSLVSRGLDCHNNKINGLLYQRSSMELDSEGAGGKVRSKHPADPTLRIRHIRM